MQTLEQIKDRLAAALPGRPVWKSSPTAVRPASPPCFSTTRRRLEIAQFLRDDPELRYDCASNVTGVDWLEKTVKEKVKVRKIIDGVEKETEEVIERKTPAFLEAVYHLYSMALGHGPLIIRLRTANRGDCVVLPSLTPVWRSCEFQEREIFDLFGINFECHPDLRRLLMWDGFAGPPHAQGLRAGRQEEAKGMIAAPPQLVTSDVGDLAGHDLLEVSMGPHHPSTHGVFRMNVVLDGETVVKLTPVFGYLHRNHEKIAEKNSYLASIPYTDRLDYICSITNNWAYALSVEEAGRHHGRRSARNISASLLPNLPAFPTTPVWRDFSCKTWALWARP